MTADTPRGGSAAPVAVLGTVPPEVLARYRERDPEGEALDALHFLAEAERRAARAGEELLARHFSGLALRVRKGQPPATGDGAAAVLSRRLHGRLLAVAREFRLDVEQAAAVALDLAEWYDPRHRPALAPERHAACVAACEGIETPALKSGIVRLLYSAVAEAEGDLAAGG